MEVDVRSLGFKILPEMVRVADSLYADVKRHKEMGKDKRILTTPQHNDHQERTSHAHGGPARNSLEGVARVRSWLQVFGEAEDHLGPNCTGR